MEGGAVMDYYYDKLGKKIFVSSNVQLHIEDLMKKVKTPETGKKSFDNHITEFYNSIDVADESIVLNPRNNQLEFKPVFGKKSESVTKRITPISNRMRVLIVAMEI